ncbi:MAG: glycosyltransferase family 9 protein [Phycisphaerales bacterium JB039]
MPPSPLRLLIVLPSWVGDLVMATPALRLIRDELPGSLVGALCRGGAEEILAGTDLIDQFELRREGMMGPKRTAGALRPHRYGAALLLSNSLSTALTCRLSGVPIRLGYDRDGRGSLLTHGLAAPRREARGRSGGKWAVVPAAAYYHHAARALLEVLRDGSMTAPDVDDRGEPLIAALPAGARLELAVTESQRRAADEILERAGASDEPFAILNPGGNKLAKRWPPERFARLADDLHERGLRVLINGAPAEAELVREIAGLARTDPVDLTALGGTLGALKGVVARARIMVTGDTGPRHFAAALGTPVVTLFGPTDHRWTTIPAPGGEEIVLACEDLPGDDLANDHPERCRVDRIGYEVVLGAVDRLLGQDSGRG